MKKATKEKNVRNNKKKSSIFDYEHEVNKSIKTTKRNKKTNKLKKYSNKSNEDDYKILGLENNTQVNKKAIKKIQKRKKNEAINESNYIQKNIRKQRKIQNEQLKDNIRKPKKKMKTTTKIIFTIIAIVVLSILFLLSPVFNIKEIQVNNCNKVSKQEVVGVLHIDENTNIFKEKNAEIKDKLKELPYIDTEKTEIVRSLPSTLCINLKERDVEYLLEFGGAFAYIDKDGNILEISTQNIDDKVKVQGYQTPAEDIKPGNKLCEQDMKDLEKLDNILKSAENYGLLDKITSANISDDKDFVLSMDEEKKKVHIGDDTGLDTKMLYVKAILEKEKGNEGEIFVNMNLNKKNAYFKQNL